MISLVKKVFFALIFLGIAFIAMAIFTSFSNGERVGFVTKFSNKGFIFKTWEGACDMGIFQGSVPKNGKVENTIWEFSVRDQAVAEKIQTANRNGSKVVLHYKEKYIRLFWMGDTKYFVYQVDEIANPQLRNDSSNYQTPSQNVQSTQEPQKNAIKQEGI